jgi:hypothetical protein
VGSALLVVLALFKSVNVPPLTGTPAAVVDWVVAEVVDDFVVVTLVVVLLVGFVVVVVVVVAVVELVVTGVLLVVVVVLLLQDDRTMAATSMTLSPNHRVFPFMFSPFLFISSQKTKYTTGRIG